MSSNAITLSASALKTISKRIRVPNYKRDAFPSIVHFGVGNFCRAHLFEYTHHFNNQTVGSESIDNEPWLIHGIGVIDNDYEKESFEKIKSSDFLYGLLTQPSNESEIIGSLCSYDWAPDSSTALTSAIDSISRPETKIISLTITEKGYCMDIDGNLDFSNPDVLHDVQLLTSSQDSLGTTTPCFKTSLGLLIEGLRQRMRNHLAGPVTIMSCDNLPSNGNVLKSILLDFVKHTNNLHLLNYIEENMSFPNSMVDRITPGVTEESISLFEKETNVADPWPVIAEDFTQWVVEDNFIAGRPSWEAMEGSDILFVEDCEPYECMKLRLLNASHTAMAYVSILAGLEKVDDSMCDESVYGYVKSYMDMATSTVPRVPGIDLEEYKSVLRFRFLNLSDDLSRLAQDGSKKMVGFVLPSLEIRLEKKQSTEIIATVVASWVHYLVKHANDVDDPRKDELVTLATAITDSISCKDNENTRLATTYFIRSTLGDCIAQEEKFVEEVENYIYQIDKNGVKTAVLDKFEYFGLEEL